nr:centrosome-associated protein CEP250-like isoform X8 [Cherax quadricarinatus]
MEEHCRRPAGPYKLDDLSSDSDDEYFDVVTVPGLRPQPGLTASPAPLQQHHHIPPTHSQSLPAINKGTVGSAMRNDAVQPLNTVIASKQSVTKAAASGREQGLSATPPCGDQKVTGDEQAPGTSVKQVRGTSEKHNPEGSTAGIESRFAVSTEKKGFSRLPKKYKAPQPPSTIEQPAPTGKQPASTVEQPAPTVEQPAPTGKQPASTVEQPAPTVEQPAPTGKQPASTVEHPAPTVGKPKGNQEQHWSDTQDQLQSNKNNLITTDMPRQILSSKEGKTHVGKQEASSPKRKPPDEVETSNELRGNGTLNKVDSKREKTLSGSLTIEDRVIKQQLSSASSETPLTPAPSPDSLPNKQTVNTTMNKTVKIMPECTTERALSSPQGQKVRQSSPVAVVGVKVTPTLVTGKLEIASNEGSATVRRNSTSEDKALDGKTARPKDTSVNKRSLESNTLTTTRPATAGTTVTKSTLEENEKLHDNVVVNGNIDEDNMSDDKSEEERKRASVSKNRENVTIHTQSENSKHKERKESIERSSRCSSVASDAASRAVSPDISLNSGAAKRSKSGKLAFVLNMWETDEVSQKSERGKPKGSSTPKIGKITGLASVFEREKSLGASQADASKSIINKLKSPYSPPFSPERKAPAEDKITNIAGISTLKFGDVAKFKKPGEPKKANDKIVSHTPKKMPDDKSSSHAHKNELDKQGIQDKDLINKSVSQKKDENLSNITKVGVNSVIDKERSQEKTGKQNTKNISKDCEEIIVNGSVAKSDSRISLDEEDAVEVKTKKDKLSNPRADQSSATVLQNSSATEPKHQPVSDTLVKTDKIDTSVSKANKVNAVVPKTNKVEDVSKNTKVEAKTSKDTKVEAKTSKDTKVEISESKDTKVEAIASKDTKVEAGASKDTKIEVKTSKDTMVEAGASKDTKIEVKTSKDTLVEAGESKDTKIEVKTSKDTMVEAGESKDTKIEVGESKDTKIEVKTSKDTKVEASSSKDTKNEVKTSKDTKVEAKTSKDTKIEARASKDTKIEVKTYKDTKVEASSSKDTKNEVKTSKDTKVEAKTSKDTKIEAIASKDTKVGDAKVHESKVIKINSEAESNISSNIAAKVSNIKDGTNGLERQNEASDLKISPLPLANADTSSISTAAGDVPTSVKVTDINSIASKTAKTEAAEIYDGQVNTTEASATKVTSECNVQSAVCQGTVCTSSSDLATNVVSSEAPVVDDACSAEKLSEAPKASEALHRMDGLKKDVLGGIMSFIESVTRGGKSLEDKLSINGLQFTKKSSKTDNATDLTNAPPGDTSDTKTVSRSENTENLQEQTSQVISLPRPQDDDGSKQAKCCLEGKQSVKNAVYEPATAVPQLESEVEALLREASMLIAHTEDITRSPSHDGGDEEVFLDAIDVSQLDTLMPLPNMEIERERRSRSRTPLEGPERSPSSRSVVAKTEALLSETDRLLRRSRSDRSLRRSYSRSMSAAALSKSAQSVLEARCELQNCGIVCRLAEVTADLSEEHNTAHLAGERLEAEQAERMKLEKEVERLQANMRLVTTVNGKLEMERQALECEVVSVNNVNGDAEHDYDDAAEASLYKRKYDWCLREIELLKKQLKQQQEDDLDHLLLMKKQLEKKVSDAYEETEEQRQVVGQLKRKSQRLQAELNDLKILLEEQASRNNLLEKKQRKFDQDMMGAQEELRHERSNKEKIQRERDQILSEKYAFEQEVTTLKLELELKEEKISALSRELEDLSFTGKTEEEVAVLKKAKHDLELRLKDQEEELDDLAGQVQMLEGAKVRLEMSIEQMRKENRREISQREEELEEVRISAQKKIKALESQLENEHEERTVVVREKHELERRINELQDRTITHVDEDYVHKLKKELKKTKALLRDTQTMLEKSQSEGGHKLLVRQLKTQLEDAEFAKTAAIKARQCAEADIQELSSQLEEAQRARKESEDRCARVAKDRAEIQTQLEESEEEVAEVMKKYKSCVSQLSVDQITLSEQSQQIAELEHEKQVLQERMLELSSKVEVLEGETANIHTQRRLEMKIKEIESKLELEQTTRQRLESQIGRLKDQIERLTGDCDAARQKETQALEQSKKISRQLREAKEDLSALQQKHTDAVNKKGELEKQLELADSEVITLKSDLKLAFKRIEDLQQAIQGDINDSDSDISDSDSDSDGSLSSYLTASLKHQRSSSNSTLRTPPSEVQQLDRMEQPNSPCSEAMSAISEDLDDVSNKESYA